MKVAPNLNTRLLQEALTVAGGCASHHESCCTSPQPFAVTRPCASTIINLLRYEGEILRFTVGCLFPICLFGLNGSGHMLPHNLLWYLQTCLSTGLHLSSKLMPAIFVLASGFTSQHYFYC